MHSFSVLLLGTFATLATAYKGGLYPFQPVDFVQTASCNHTSAALDLTVELSAAFMDSGFTWKGKGLCGQSVNITIPLSGLTTTGLIVDTCKDCKTYDMKVAQNLCSFIGSGAQSAVPKDDRAAVMKAVPWNGPAEVKWCFEEDDLLDGLVGSG